jgi:hypothetical protein
MRVTKYRPVAKRWLCKQRPFLGNSSVNMFPLLGNNTWTTTIETDCFYVTHSEIL